MMGRQRGWGSCEAEKENSCNFPKNETKVVAYEPFKLEWHAVVVHIALLPHTSKVGVACAWACLLFGGLWGCRIISTAKK
mmetsp:Transcript_46421/g.63229  ORF Transcript_46421/g.63229 Transcript_46421/m.63229 type:complete len:80 (-) Transcript_46421:8-247(-)